MVNNERIRRTLKEMRPIDDTLMRALFRDNEKLVLYVLNTILNKNLVKLLKIETQYDAKQVTNARSLTLDIIAVDDKNVIYNIEVQNSRFGATPRRARYHHSIIDVESLKKSEDLINYLIVM